jgi:hypothetical protein
VFFSLEQATQEQAMSSFVMRHPVDGSDVEIKNPLRAEHVEVGRLLWYAGLTSISGWDCPAIITRVNGQRQFRVRSLDDMKEQDQWYSAGCNKHSPTSRQTMRIPKPEEVRIYLEKRHALLVENIADAKADLASAEAALAHFDELRTSLTI